MTNMRFKLLPVFLLAYAVVMASADENADESSSSTEPPSSTASSTASPTEPPSSTASSTASPTEPPTSTASPTEPSSSTASPTEPSSSTASPTEPSSSTTSSTESSSSTTSSTTSSTEPSSSTVSQNGWDDYPIHVPGEAGKPPCIFSKMNISLTVTYEKKDNTNTTSTVFVPKEVSPSGSCNDTVSIMTLSWAVPPKPQTRYAKSFYNLYADDGNEITFHFKKDNSSIKVSQIDINILLDSVNYPDAKNPSLTATTGDTLNLFATSPEGKRYVCNTETVVSTNSGGVELTITDVNLIAFNQEEDLKQISEENCLNEETIESANVGAIVGGIIAAVVVVGIVGFIIWRRRRNSYAHSEVA